MDSATGYQNFLQQVGTVHYYTAKVCLADSEDCSTNNFVGSPDYIPHDRFLSKWPRIFENGMRCDAAGAV